MKTAREGRLDVGPGSHAPQTALNLAEELTALRRQVKDQVKEIRRLKEENEFLEEARAFLPPAVGSLQNAYHPNSNSQLFSNLSLSFSLISKSFGLIYSPLMLPSTIYSTLEHFAATFASWVTIIIVVPSSFNFTSSAITSFDDVLFKAPVGSSANRTLVNGR